MSKLDPIMNEAFHRLTATIEVDYLLKASFEDGIPLTKHQAQAIQDLSTDIVKAGGFYTFANLEGGLGSAFVFYTAKGDIKKVVQLNFPIQSPDRKIPRRQWLKDIFEHIGYKADRLEIKMVYRLIESHIRDGGTWEASMNGTKITFVLKINAKVKQYLEFHQEDLSL